MERVLGIRQSGAAGPHADRRYRRKRTRQAETAYHLEGTRLIWSDAHTAWVLPEGDVPDYRDGAWWHYDGATRQWVWVDPPEDV